MKKVYIPLLVVLFAVSVSALILVNSNVQAAYTDTVNNANYASTGVYYDFTMTHMGSAVGENVDCRTQTIAPDGYVLNSRHCVLDNGSNCLSDICLWKKASTQAYDFTTTHSGSAGSPAPLVASDCRVSTNPGNNYTLKNWQCLASTGSTCISDICLWSRPATTVAGSGNAFTTTHTGSAGSPAPLVGHDCRTEANPGNGYTLESRQCLMSTGSICISDICLWKATTGSTANVTCSSNSDCGSNGFIGANFCQGNSVYQNYRTFTCNNPGTTNSSCSSSITSQVQNNCGSNQTCSSGSCITTNTCTSNSYQSCVGNNKYWFDSCGNQQSFVGPCSTTTCTSNSYQSCVGNNKYWYDSCGNQQSYVGPCTTTTCTPRHTYKCSGNGVYWFDSCGNKQELYQACTGNQTCPTGGNVCVNQNVNANLSVLVQVRNLSAGNLTWTNSVSAMPSDIVQFSVTVQATGNTYANNVTIKDVLPNNLIYKNALTIDGVSNSGSVINGVNIGSLSYGQTRVLTYQAQVAGAGNFAFGTTTLANMVNATTTDVYSNQANGNASVVVTRSGIIGTTTVPTGLTNNIWVDSFFLPLILAFLGLWLWKSGILHGLGIGNWLSVKKANYRNTVAGKELQNKINHITQQENA